MIIKIGREFRQKKQIVQFEPIEAVAWVEMEVECDENHEKREDVIAYYSKEIDKTIRSEVQKTLAIYGKEKLDKTNTKDNAKAEAGLDAENL